MNMISQLSVLVLLLIIAIVFFMTSRKAERASGAGGHTRPYAAPAPELAKLWERGEKPRSGGTMLMPILVIEQLHPHTNEVVKSFPITTIPPEGLTISRPDAGKGTCRLSDEVRSARSVSSEHLIIGRDEKGIFAQDNHSSNGTRIMGREEKVDEVAITDGLILLLGYQPVRFRLNSFKDFFRNMGEEELADPASHHGPQPIRRRK